MTDRPTPAERRKAAHDAAMRAPAPRLARANFGRALASALDDEDDD